MPSKLVPVSSDISSYCLHFWTTTPGLRSLLPLPFPLLLLPHLRLLLLVIVYHDGVCCAPQTLRDPLKTLDTPMEIGDGHDGLVEEPLDLCDLNLEVHNLKEEMSDD